MNAETTTRERLRSLPAVTKIGVVGGALAVALLVAAAGVSAYQAATDDAAAQASSGMYAFDEALLLLTLFAALAVVPAGLAFFFLRPYRLFWRFVAVSGLALASTGVTAAIIYALAQSGGPAAEVATFAGIAVLRMLVAPLFAAGWMVAGAFAPTRGTRIALFTTAAIEAAVTATLIVLWLVHVAGG